MSVYPEGAEVTREAVISADDVYRYILRRRWGSGPDLTFVMLNPSTADATFDDPTIQRCVGFARRLGFGGIVALNLFAFRATQPADMLAAADPVGDSSDRYLRNHALRAQAMRAPVIAAWGNNAPQERVAEVMALPGFSEVLYCFGTTISGAPKHPLARGRSRIPDDLKPLRWPLRSAS